MNRIRYTLIALMALLGFTAVQAQCPQNFLTAQPQILGNNLNLVVFNQGNAALPISLNITYGDNQTGGGIMTSAFTAVHQYALPGIYDLCIVGIDANQCVDTLCTQVAVTSCPPGTIQMSVVDSVFDNSVYLYVDPIGGMPPYTFYASSENQTSTGWPLSFTYNTPGYHQYCITVTDGSGCMGTYCDSTFVGPACNVQPFFVWNSIPTSNTVVFTATAGGGTGPYTFDWYFNGVPYTTTAPGFTYQGAPGIYQVCLVVTDANNCQSTYCQSVTVGPDCFSNPITASFATSLSGDTLSVIPTATGGCGQYTYTYTTSGGGQFLGTTNPAMFYFPQDGNYTILAVVTDACSCNLTYSIPVTIGCSSATATNLNMGSGASVFTTCNTNFYDPGGPNGQYANSQNFTQTFYPAQSGNQLSVTFSSYDLETNYDYLYIYNGTSVNAPLIATLNGTSSNTVTYNANNTSGALTFRFTSDASVLRAGWVANVSCGGVGFTYTSTNNGPNMQFVASSSSPNIASYLWDFGDGATSTSGATTTHAYATGGSYQVCLTITTTDGCSFSNCQNVFVPCGDFLNAQTSVAGNVVTVTINDYNPNYFYSFFLNNNTQTWQQLSGPVTTITLPSPGTFNACIYADGACFDSTCTSITISAEGADTISGWVWNDANGNGIYDADEQPLASSYVQICAGTDTTTCQWAYTDTTGFYQFVVFDGDYNLTAWSWGNMFNVQTFPVNGAPYSLSVSGGTNQGNFNFGFQSQSASISGTVYQDNNGNGVHDSGEPVLPNKLVQISNWYWVYTNASGEYHVDVPVGALTITLGNVPNGYVITQPAMSPFQYSLNPSVGQVFTGLDFGLYADPDLIDLSASIYNISTVTPGFPVMNHMSYCNNSAMAQSGTFTLYYDPQLAIASGSVFSPAPASFDANAHSATWNFSNLAPGACQYIYWNSPAPVSLSLGLPIVNAVVVTPINDANPTNNIDTTHQVVVGSWDPNDKHASPAGEGEEGFILPNTPLTYTIRFQNTGTAPAVNVVLVDTISTEFVLESFHMNGASHPYQVVLDNDTRTIRWTFNNIMLPDSTSDPLGSIGYVNFRLNPQANQADGTVLPNFCDIYFDFNEPIRTNTSINTINRSLGINSTDAPAVDVYPNPSNGLTWFRIDTPNGRNAKVEVLNVLGQTVSVFSAESGKTVSFDGSKLAPGLYVYRVSANGKTQTGKLVLR
jgi:uncharacterized repeat protein (TIGR01451 family)